MLNNTTYFYFWDWFLCIVSVPVYLFESIWEIQISVKKVIGGKIQICKNIVKTVSICILWTVEGTMMFHMSNKIPLCGD